MIGYDSIGYDIGEGDSEGEDEGKDEGERSRLYNAIQYNAKQSIISECNDMHKRKTRLFIDAVEEESG